MGKGRHIFSFEDNADMAQCNTQLGVMLSIYAARLFWVLR